MHRQLPDALFIYSAGKFNNENEMRCSQNGCYYCFNFISNWKMSENELFQANKENGIWRTNYKQFINACELRIPRRQFEMQTIMESLACNLIMQYGFVYRHWCLYCAANRWNEFSFVRDVKKGSSCLTFLAMSFGMKINHHFVAGKVCPIHSLTHNRFPCAHFMSMAVRIQIAWASNWLYKCVRTY